MESFLLLLEAWWWTAPAAAGLGAVTYGAVTARGRRARRIELDAARHEEERARAELTNARAATRNARAEVMSARARAGSPIAPEVWQAKRRLQDAKRAEKSAALEVRASRTRIKATAKQLSAGGSSRQLPIERLFAAHDEVNMRYGAYLTDAEKAMAYPLFADARHPAILAFLHAQRAAQHARPGSARERVTPAEFIAYRGAIDDLRSAFDAAERAAFAARQPTWHEPPAAPPSARAPETDAAASCTAVEPEVPPTPLAALSDRAKRIWPVPRRDRS